MQSCKEDDDGDGSFGKLKEGHDARVGGPMMMSGWESWVSFK